MPHAGQPATGGLIVPLALPGPLARRELVRQAADRGQSAAARRGDRAACRLSDGAPTPLPTAAKLRQAVLRAGAGRRSRSGRPIRTVRRRAAGRSNRPRPKPSAARLPPPSAKQFGLTLGELKGKSRQQTIAEARGLAMYLVRRLTRRQLCRDRPAIRQPRPHHRAARLPQVQPNWSRSDEASAATGRRADSADRRRKERVELRNSIIRPTAEWTTCCRLSSMPAQSAVRASTADERHRPIWHRNRRHFATTADTDNEFSTHSRAVSAITSTTSCLPARYSASTQRRLSTESPATLLRLLIYRISIRASARQADPN